MNASFANLAAAMFTIGFLAWPVGVVAVRKLRSKREASAPLIAQPAPADSPLLTNEAASQSLSLPAAEPLLAAALPAEPDAGSVVASAKPSVHDESASLEEAAPAPKRRRRAKRKPKDAAATKDQAGVHELNGDAPRPAAPLQEATVSESMESFFPII